MANPRGQQRDKPFRDALRVETKLAEGGQPTPAEPGSLRYIARQLLIRAGDDTAAAKEVGDRLDGKSVQAVESTITRVNAKQMSDDELANIASGSSDNATDEAEPTQVTH
jgi:hypothetical protein